MRRNQLMIVMFCVGTVICSCSDNGKVDMNTAGLFFSGDNSNSTVDREKLDAMEYIKWLEDDKNGIKVSKTMGEFTFSSLYKPSGYLALQELKSKYTDKKLMSEKENEYKGMQYFSFRISAEHQDQELLKVGLNSEGEYYSRIEYFSFKMQKDLKLIDGRDTLDCALFHFERVYGLAPYATFILGFPLTQDQERAEMSAQIPTYKNKTLLYEDSVFGAGNIYITTRAENLNRIPELSIN